MKRILVAGGVGFLGSNLCRILLNESEDNEIICLDNFLTGCLENVKELLDNTRFSFYEHDVINPLPDMYVDEIYNLACPASPPHYQKDPVYTTKTNVLGMLNLLELAKKNNARILQASTSEVYGDPAVHPQKEDYRGNVNCTGVRSCYDEGKRCAESLAFDYHRMYGVEVKVIRIFNTYGPKMSLNDGRVISNFILQCLQGKDITIYGDGSQTRSICYVDDLLDGMIKMMVSPNGFLGPVNLGNPEEYTIKEIAEKIKQLVNSESGIIYKPLPQDDPLMRKPDISLAEKTLGWRPKINSHEGLKRTIAYFREQLSCIDEGAKDEF